MSAIQVWAFDGFLKSALAQALAASFWQQEDGDTEGMRFNSWRRFDPDIVAK